MFFTEPNKPQKKYKLFEFVAMGIALYLMANAVALLIAMFVYSLGAERAVPLAKVLPTIALARWVIVD